MTQHMRQSLGQLDHLTIMFVDRNRASRIVRRVVKLVDFQGSGNAQQGIPGSRFFLFLHFPEVMLRKNHGLAADFFAVGVILALLTGVEPDWVDALAMLFIAFRVAYIFFYVTDKAKWRTMVWSGAYVVVLALFAMAMLNLHPA
jgi:hypothetical protein